MRILMITHGIYPLSKVGGVEIYASEIAHELSKQHDLSVLIFTATKNSDKPSPFHCKVENINTITVPGSRDQIPDKRFTSLNFRSLLESLKPDLIYIMSAFMLPLRILEGINIPYILHLHDFSLICPRAILRQSNGTSCKKPKCLVCAKCLAKIRHPISFFKKVIRFNERMALAKSLLINARVVFCVSEHSAKIYSKYGLRRENVIRVSPVQAWKTVSSPKKAPADGVLRIGFLNGKSEHKGFNVLAKALKTLTFPWLLEIYGIQNEKQKENIFHVFRGFEDKIHTHGSYESKDLDQIFSKIDILAAPSVWPETYCRVVDEALERKVFVLASDIGGMVERLVDGVNAFLVQPGNAGAVAEKLTYIYKNFEALQGKVMFDFNADANHKDIILDVCKAIGEKQFVNGLFFERKSDIDIISKITGVPCNKVEKRLLEEAQNPGSTVNAAWTEYGSPKNPKDVLSFYQSNDAYLYDLLVAHTGHTAWERNQWRKVALSVLKRMGCDSVLDYGAGIGMDSIYFAKSGIHVTHFDVNVFSRKFVKIKSVSSGVVVDIVSDLNVLKPSSFDAVYCTEVLEHLPDPTEVLKHIYSLLKPGGYLLATESFGTTGDEFLTHIPENSIYAGQLGSIGNGIGFRLCEELSVLGNKLYLLERK
jgi:glycosyltransferase involved in cell wall biosynthesis